MLRTRARRGESRRKRKSKQEVKRIKLEEIKTRSGQRGQERKTMPGTDSSCYTWRRGGKRLKLDCRRMGREKRGQGRERTAIHS